MLVILIYICLNFMTLASEKEKILEISQIVLSLGGSCIILKTLVKETEIEEDNDDWFQSKKPIDSINNKPWSTASFIFNRCSEFLIEQDRGQ